MMMTVLLLLLRTTSSQWDEMSIPTIERFQEAPEEDRVLCRSFFSLLHVLFYYHLIVHTHELICCSAAALLLWFRSLTLCRKEGRGGERSSRFEQMSIMMGVRSAHTFFLLNSSSSLDSYISHAASFFALDGNIWDWCMVCGARVPIITMRNRLGTWPTVHCSISSVLIIHIRIGIDCILNPSQERRNEWVKDLILCSQPEVSGA